MDIFQNTTGSGYEDLRGSVINYGYDNFEDFNIMFYNNRGTWHGQKGYFAGNIREIIPQISKVADGIYFASWAAGPQGKGGDNVVFNTHTMRVNAHVFDAHGESMIMPLRGSIYKINGDAVFPRGELTADADAFVNVQRNIKEKNLPPQPYSKELSTFEEDIVARKELEGKTISYASPRGTLSITFQEKTMLISEKGQEKEFLHGATKIAEDIYFISWEDVEEVDGEKKNIHANIMVNCINKKVFSHIQPDGTRKEEISDLL